MLNFFLAQLLCLFPLVNIGLLGNYSGFVASSSLSSFITEDAMIRTLDFIIPFFFAWLCVSLLTNVFPLFEDSIVMKEQYKKLNVFLKIIFFPGFIVMRVGSWLEKYGLTFVLLITVTFILAIAKP